MNGVMIFPAGYTAALQFACRYLKDRGFQILDSPAPDATHLLLPVPAFEPDGRIRGGGILEHILCDLPKDITVVGGNLSHPALEGYQKLDLLQDADYVAKNAAITADCAIRVAASRLPVIWEGCPVLILGWGRIGKCLAFQLKAAGAKVTVAARKTADRAITQALGLRSTDIINLEPELYRNRVVFNTVPSPVCDSTQAPNCLKIDLASQRGILGNDVLHARGLPGKDTPESSGILIAQTLIRLLVRKEQKT